MLRAVRIALLILVPEISANGRFNLGHAMESLIRVELKDGTICRMAIKAFNVFLSHGKIARFERAEGWVVVGRDPLRSMEESDDYAGRERRAVIPV